MMSDVGVKYDQDKPEYGLIPPHAMHEMVKVLTAGAKKYSRDNWQKVPDRKRRYFDALERHIWAWKRGEELDSEDGLSHLAHAACCLFFLYEVDKFYNEESVPVQQLSLNFNPIKDEDAPTVHASQRNRPATGLRFK